MLTLFTTRELLGTVGSVSESDSMTETSLFSCALVPAAVRSLVLTGSDTDRLNVTWSAAPGDVDHYEVQLLFSDMKVFPPITLGSGVEACVLSSLTPGRLYKILVSTFSGPNQRVQFIEGRTGQHTGHSHIRSNALKRSLMQVPPQFLAESKTSTSVTAATAPA